MPDGNISNGSKSLVNDPEFWVLSRHEACSTNLAFRVDTYGGVIFESADLPIEGSAFHHLFSCSLEHVSRLGYHKAYWISVPVERCELVPLIIKDFGFYVHHAKKEYFMLVKWNDLSRPDPIPSPSMHQVGVGCVILRADGCILLVKERSGPAAVKGGIWKLPTGLVDPTEDLQDAALREAKEETCLDCSFDSIICFRHSHGGSTSLGATSDLFFVCLLRMLDNSQETCLQESEILDSCWVHVSEIHERTGCAEGTAAREIMERIALVVSKNTSNVISCKKLPAWRRNNCDQFIFYPNDSS